MGEEHFRWFASIWDDTDRQLLYSERKIDRIARDVEDIKSLLQGFGAPEVAWQRESEVNQTQTRLKAQIKEPQGVSTSTSERHWDYSAHILDFVKAVVATPSSTSIKSASSETIDSLSSLIEILDDPSITQSTSKPKTTVLGSVSSPQMVPTDQVIEILRWARGAFDVIRCIELGARV